ncbi:benzoate/H(+) symporter BenE family transporter [Alkaliphilus serpentinus]|uniref:Benzoate transporter n=1 Tax=Alkaliphilus serpentinus TaxID=1482731 RepID=A0A833HNK3_9FIRM|nr:benzoate/H(+) symporter BenE family transporter [Alkaliphilus serpentinus]KAB3529693.1 benzoate transporter [Alkaliphilus serpentinus]
MKINKPSQMMDFSQIINIKNISAGLVAGIFGCTGPALLIINAAQNLKLSKFETSSWLFAIYFFGGIIGIVLSTKYKIPISGAYTIAGSVLLLNNVSNYNYNELTGAFLVSGLTIFIIGISGLKAKILKYIPLPIVMAMIGGSLTRFGIGIVNSAKELPLLGAITLATFLIAPKFTKRVPPVLFALIIGMITSVIMQTVYLSNLSLNLALPVIVQPKFNINAIFSIAIPLSILILGSENAQAIGILFSQGYKPPVNAMTVASGLGGIAASLFGGHAANIAGPMTAIFSSEEAGNSHTDRYKASIINGIIFVVFGIFSSVALGFVTAFPRALMNIIAGLSMIGVLKRSYKDAFSVEMFSNGAFFSFIIALSNIQILNISAPLWALFVGVMISLVSEHHDFYNMINNSSDRLV